MHNKTILIILFSINILACKEDNIKYLAGKWRAVKYQNYELDSIFTNGQAFIDTMGKGDNDSAMMHIYGFTNMDSARKSMQQLHDEAIAAQNEQIKKTLFIFQSNGLALVSFGGQTDSNKWTVDNERNLIIEPMDKAAAGQILKLKIVTLDKEEMTLRFKENTDSSTVTFRRDEK
jgi:hypothetical protein